MQNIERSDTDLAQKNRQLRNALETLLDELETEGPPDTARVREHMPAKQGIRPPWERDGYGSKEEWLQEKKDQ